MSRRRAAVIAAALLAVAAVLPSPVPRPVPAALQPIRPIPVRSPTASSVQLGPAVMVSLPNTPTPEPRLVLGATTGERLIALTFDLDMSPEMARQLHNGAVSAWINQDALDVLRATGTPATLFMTGMWAELYPGLARALARDPNFEIANHSYSHPAFHLPCYGLGGVSRGGAAWQLSRAQEVIRQITGATPHFFRFPGGCYDGPALDAVHAAGMVPVQWTVNGMDAFNPNAAGVAATVIGRVQPGSIVLLHLQGGANAPATGPALRIIIPALRQRGYRLVTISELLRLGVPLQPSGVHEIVEAYPPAPSPPPPLLAPAAGNWAVMAPRVVPLRPCWRWNVRLRTWVRC